MSLWRRRDRFKWATNCSPAASSGCQRERNVYAADSLAVAFLKEMAAAATPAVRRLGINAIELPHTSWHIRQ